MNNRAAASGSLSRPRESPRASAVAPTPPTPAPPRANAVPPSTRPCFSGDPRDRAPRTPDGPTPSRPRLLRTMGEPSKELLDLPSDPRPPASFIESLLLSRDQQPQQQNKEGKRKSVPPTDPLPKSQVLGKVKDFLGEIAKANQKLQLDTQNKPPEEYDIEALTGNEEEYIEMDLLLGVADLHSEQAVEAAEATINGFQPSGIPFTCSSSDSEDSSDDSDENRVDKPIVSDKDTKCKVPVEGEVGAAEEKKANKRQKIVVLN